MGGKTVSWRSLVFGALACARPADAGWLDFIWEMSGPQMIGVGCRLRGEPQQAVTGAPSRSRG